MSDDQFSLSDFDEEPESLEGVEYIYDTVLKEYLRVVTEDEEKIPVYEYGVNVERTNGQITQIPYWVIEKTERYDFDDYEEEFEERYQPICPAVYGGE